MTRSSDVVVTGALITTDGGSHQVSLDIPLMNGDERTVRFTLEPTIGGLRGRSPDAPAGEQMEFTEVDIVDPELAP